MQPVEINLQDQSVPGGADEGFKIGELELRKTNGEFNYDFRQFIFTKALSDMRLREGKDNLRNDTNSF